ncbi:MAG: phosphoenolpyruvate--protein phosphotransferase [Sphingomonadales bacterium]|nr:MAG: phosphoenolpyruvate--protein phosphotransferase [Sphingomonadales bacterium]
MADLIITAPLKGWAAPLEEVPDPVFASRLIGDGVAIHPTGSTIHAPCDGVIAALHAAGHAVTIRNAAGAEILVHTGLDTVALKGKGFRALVVEGAKVLRGDPLIEFDLDAVAQAATSLITPVIVINSDAFRIERRTTGQLVGVGEALMTLAPVAAEERDWALSDGETHRRTITVPLVHGVHARPAARIGECARGFEAEVEILHGAARANARSAVKLMTLGLKQGDSFTIEGRGRDAREAIRAVGDLIASGMGETAAVATPAAAAPVVPTAPEGALAGVTAAPGLAIGVAAWLTTEVPEIARDAPDLVLENTAFDSALARVRQHIDGAAARGSAAQRQILEAHLAFLSDEDLLAAARAHVAAGRSAGFAWSQAIASQTVALRASGDARFAERADDLEDLERQVLLALAGREPAGQPFGPGTILLAHELLPSQLIGLDSGKVTGVVLSRGGATSHVAIIAASMGLPMLVATGTPLTTIADGAQLVLDAEAGLLHVDPAAGALDLHRQRLVRLNEGKAAALAAAKEPCRTADGVRIELFANLGSVDDAVAAVARGAEGSGLLRTEFLFMDRATAPGEDEQRATYQAIADAMAGRPIIVRLLDIGGDKPAPWLPIAPEKNPMLGVRGIRATLANPELLDAQLRAILQVRPAGQCRIMVPMVAGLDELRAVRAAVARLGGRTVQIGVMIETPAAAATADLIAAEADFLSIGTNDLTQYTLAMDRENSAVASGIDALHPAVLRLIGHSCEGGARHGKIVGVCGGLASDPLGIPLLIGLGATELSTTPSFVPEAKALVRRLDLERCRLLAEEALNLGSASEIRALVRAFVEEFA